MTYREDSSCTPDVLNILILKATDIGFCGGAGITKRRERKRATTNALISVPKFSVRRGVRLPKRDASAHVPSLLR